jgi:VWFA-related protein
MILKVWQPRQGKEYLTYSAAGRSSRLKIGHFSLTILLLVFPVFPQERTSAPRSQATNPMTLDVVVSEKSGKPVSGLEKQDFVVADNKQPQKILSFQAVQGPQSDSVMEVVLLIDRVNTSFQSAANESEQTKKFLRQNGGQLALPVSMVFFADSGTTIQPATRDGNMLVTALDQSDDALRTSRRSQGIYGAEDRIQWSLNALHSIAAYEAKKPGRKLLIWLSPGWAMLSGPGTELSSKDQKNIFSMIVTASTEMLQARLSLYSIDPLGVADAVGYRTTFYQDFLKGVKSARDAQIGDLSLQALAVESGGRVLNSSNDIAGEIAQCVEDANAWYVLTFDAPPADGPNDYHKLDVKVDRPGTTARTRTGYYSQQ